MRLRDSLGLNISPLFLRFVLALTFLWAGLGKFLVETHYTPEQAAKLAAMGVKIQAQPLSELPKAEDESNAAAEESPAEEAAPGADEQPRSEPEAATPPAAEAGPVAAQYPNGAELRRVYGLALLLEAAAHPGFDGNGDQMKPIWPSALAANKWPVWIALAAGVCEILGGVGMLFGFLTRLAAIDIACIMASAIWLTQLGPAMQSGDTMLFVLPNHAVFDTEPWVILLWNLSLFCGAMAMLFLGAGGLSLDRLIFGGPTEVRRVPKGERED